MVLNFFFPEDVKACFTSMLKYNWLVIADCKVVIYNYILCWLSSMTKSVVSTLNCVPCILWDFIVLGLVLSWSRIEHELKN